MVTGGNQVLVAILIVSECRLSPCGGCLDWIFEYGGEGCLVRLESQDSSTPVIYRAKDLMPYYPEK
jgi:cytidine deaminase